MSPLTVIHILVLFVQDAMHLLHCSCTRQPTFRTTCHQSLCLATTDYRRFSEKSVPPTAGSSLPVNVPTPNIQEIKNIIKQTHRH